MTTILQYRDMASDAVRIGAFRRAIAAAVRPGDVVVDIGCGLGTYGLFACGAGARKVYDIEREDIILVARRIARANGCADRIEFLRGDALSMRLRERADVVVLEDFAATFVEPETERVVRHAVRRLMKRSGRIIPARVDVFAAPVEAHDLYRRIDHWGDANDTAYGIDFSATRGLAMNSIHRAGLRGAALVGSPKRVHSIDLAGGTPFPFDAALRFRARKAAVVHGLAVWFEAELADRVRLSNRPGAPPTLWGQGFLALAKPIRVGKGAAISAALAVRFSRDSRQVWWQWEVEAAGACEDGSTFRSFPTSLADLEAGSREHRPGLSEDGEIALCVLRMLKSGCRIVEVGRALRRRFPARFAALGEAVSRAAAEARKYGARPGIQEAIR